MSQATDVRDEVSLDPAAFAEQVASFLASLPDDLAPAPERSGLADEIARTRRLQQVLFDAGYSRAGWPAVAGGFDGTPLLRTILGEALVDAGLMTGTSFTAWAFAEILGPTFLEAASPDLVAEVFTPFLAGREGWCQGFSEPDAGSDLAAMTTRAEPQGDGTWRLHGHKVWTSFAQFATRCVVLARTGAPAEGRRGISAFLVDMDWPGIETRPLGTMAGKPEFCELHLDDVEVPQERLIGAPGEGWTITMKILACERGAVMWQESALLRRALGDLLARDIDDGVDPGRVGDVFLDLYALRARSRRTQRTLADGRQPGIGASIDKVLDTAAHQSVFDLVREVEPRRLAFGGEPSDLRLREEFMYSRAASIYGGTSEIQRNTIAQRLLDLPKDT